MWLYVLSVVVQQPLMSGVGMCDVLLRDGIDCLSGSHALVWAIACCWVEVCAQRIEAATAGTSAMQGVSVVHCAALRILVQCSLLQLFGPAEQGVVDVASAGAAGVSMGVLSSVGV